MAIFLLELPAQRGGGSRVNAVRAMVVEAIDAASAKSLASAQDEGDESWADAVATTIAAPFAANYDGFRWVVKVSGAAGGGAADAVSVEHVGSGGETIDSVGADLVILLNATVPISASAYVGATNTLTVTGVADNLGNRKLLVEVYPPGAKRPMAELVGAIVDGGAVGAATTVVLNEPANIPAVLRKL